MTVTGKGGTVVRDTVIHRTNFGVTIKYKTGTPVNGRCFPAFLLPPGGLLPRPTKTNGPTILGGAVLTLRVP